MCEAFCSHAVLKIFFSPLNCFVDYLSFLSLSLYIYIGEFDFERLPEYAETSSRGKCKELLSASVFNST